LGFLGPELKYSQSQAHARPSTLPSGIPSGELVEVGKNEMRSKSEIAWETVAKCAALAQEADDPEGREHYARLRDAWTTLAKRCEPFNFPDVTA
jgi:hypothetical protein